MTHVALAADDPELAALLARDALTASDAANGAPDLLAAGMADVANGAVLALSDVDRSEQALDRGLARLRALGEPLLVAEACSCSHPSGAACKEPRPAAPASPRLESCSNGAPIRGCSPSGWSRSHGP